MIVLQAGLFWSLAEGVVFPILVCLISTPAIVKSRRWEMSSQTLALVDLGLAGTCAMHWYLAPCELRNISPFLMYPLIHAAAEFFLLAQVARLWGRLPDRVLPAYLPMLAVLVFICLGDIDATRRQRLLYQDAMLVLLGLMCVYYGQSRRIEATPGKTRATAFRFAISVTLLLVTAVVVRESNAWVRSKWMTIENWLAEVSGHRGRARRRDALAGFSGGATLDSVQFLKNQMNRQVALRIQSEEAPEYLRGAVFERLTRRGWDWNANWLPVSQVRKPVNWQSIPSDNQEWNQKRTIPVQRFTLRPTTGRPERPMVIWRESSLDQFTFLPLTTTSLDVAAEVLIIDRHSIVAGESIAGDRPLTAWVSIAGGTTTSVEPMIQPNAWTNQQPFRLSDELHWEAHQQYLQIPRSASSEVASLALELFADCETPTAKIAAVKRYFSEFRYSGGIQLPADVSDPLSHFLLNKVPAHCEYFASGTALLLRLGQVPCRYVTGYIGGEYNPMGKYWIVRQQDAHAWVEAYLPDQGWTIVETTPTAGLARPSDNFDPWNIWDEINLRGQMIRAALSSNTFGGMLTALKLFGMTLLTTVPGWLFTSGVLFLLLRQISWKRRPRLVAEVDAAVLDLRRLLEELEVRLRRIHLRREPHETLHQFAERLRAEGAARPALLTAADWYLAYAAARYRHDPANHDTGALRQQLTSICEELLKGS